MTANIRPIAGSDPSGRAGIPAEIQVISANGGYGLAAETARNARGVSGSLLLEPSFVHHQIVAVFADIRIDAVKIGISGAAAIVVTVAEVLRLQSLPVVFDPVILLQVLPWRRCATCCRSGRNRRR